MSEDRLKEIKKRANNLHGEYLFGAGGERDYYRNADEDVDYLISELEKCRAESAELNALFDLQHSRSQKAESMWQEATNNSGTLPDLGTLLAWLMGKLEKCREEIQRHDDYHCGGAILQAELNRQRRHRKWVLRELKEKQALWRNYCGEVSEQMVKVEKQKRKRKYAIKTARQLLREGRLIDKEADRYYKQAEKFKKRIGELLVILQKHEIAV